MTVGADNRQTTYKVCHFRDDLLLLWVDQNSVLFTTASRCQYPPAFDSEFSGFFGALFSVVFDEVLVGDDFCFDKAAFKVGVDYGCCLGC